MAGIKNWRGEPVDLSQGTKLDSGKLRYDLEPQDSRAEYMKVLTFGATKYEDRNWEKGIKFGRCYAAAQRHLSAWWSGETYDQETGINHLAHALCCINFLLAYQCRGMDEYDDRPSSQERKRLEEAENMKAYYHDNEEFDFLQEHGLIKMLDDAGNWVLLDVRNGKVVKESDVKA